MNPDNKPKYWVTWLMAAICTIPALLFIIAILLGDAPASGMAALIGLVVTIWLVIVGITFAIEYDERN